MYQIKYIIVNDSAAKGSACESRNRFIPHIGHCIDINCGNRTVLIEQLCKLRKQWPEAPILGESELPSTSSGQGSHAPVRVSAAMNALRREMSDLP